METYRNIVEMRTTGIDKERIRQKKMLRVNCEMRDGKAE